jgi:hypothetical protein
MFRWFAIVPALFVTATHAGWFSYDNYEDCMLGKMKGQNTTMYMAADKECKRQFKVEFSLFKEPKWSFETQYGDMIVHLEDDEDYEVTSGEFLFSEKPCAESKPDDFRPASIRFQGGIGKYTQGIRRDLCAKSVSFRGRYK